MVLSAKEIRSGFISFFEDKGHQPVSSSPIVPIDDETLLFANAGMNQFKDIFVGLTAPKYKRVVNSQKCLRVSGKHNDLEEVGRDTYHHTFFEMLGNWSFDDYFKAEAIEWAWELLTKVWGINPDQLWATVFAGDKEYGLPADKEAAELWTKVTPIPAERVLAFGRKDNFWEMGSTGPCGPCSEIHIDLGPDSCDKKKTKGHKCQVNAGCSRYIELWNLVFIQYNRREDGKLAELDAKYVDTGAGLERVAAVLQNKPSNYDTDLFAPIINRIGDITGQKYNAKLDSKVSTSFRVIADHIRTLVFAITDGASPSNEGRGYVIRRILRRAARFGRTLGMHEPFIYELVPTVVDLMSDAFAEIKERAQYVGDIIESEEAGFGRTLDRGIEIFGDAAQRALGKKDKTINGDDAFELYDTYGFPLDLTQLMATERGLEVDTARFEELMEQQRERARAAQKTTAMMMVTNNELPTTDDSLKYCCEKCDATVVGLIEDSQFKTDGLIESGKEVGVVLDRTCFYAEAGGQVGDCGTIESDQGEMIVESTMKISNCVVHQGKLARGRISVGDKVKAVVSPDRDSIRKNHTATHLLQWALQEVCGKGIAQQGSLVGPDYLRFDFTHPKALTAEQIGRVENLVREKISANIPLTCTVMPKEHALKLGAMALFGEKYGDEVRVVAIGAENDAALTEAFSREFCGGIHVEKTGVIGGFKIIKEESISAGVRRITALAGHGLNEFLEKRSDIIDELSQKLKVPAEGVAARVEQLLKDNKKLTKQLKAAEKAGGTDVMGKAKELLDGCEKIGTASVVIGRLSTTSVEQGRSAIDMVKKKAKSAAVVFGLADADKVTLLVGVTDDLVKVGLKAGDIVKEIAPIVGGGGGGRPQMAQAGGKNPQKIEEALASAHKLIKAKLEN